MPAQEGVVTSRDAKATMLSSGAALTARYGLESWFETLVHLRGDL